MFNCTTEKYDDLYEPWLREPDTLLRFGSYKPGERLLDLCGGTGAVSRAALHIGEGDGVKHSDITLVDINPRCKDTRVLQIPAKAENVGELQPKSFDLVVCRQAMGYLDPAKVFSAVSTILKPGGRFVFNTFSRPGWFRRKTYSHNGVWYLEVSFVIWRRIIHLQYKAGSGWDISIFKYHDSDFLTRLLTPWFHIEVQSHGRGLHWLCTRLPERET